MSSNIRTIIVRRTENNNLLVEDIDDSEIPYTELSNLQIYNDYDGMILHPVILALTHSLIAGDDLMTDLEEEKNKLTDDEFKNLETCSEISNCAICMENKKMNIKLKCNHIFCKGCIKKWLTEKSNTCPNCRTEI